MPKNFYNLPPAWNPGYAIPKATMDEGLQRRAFITAMTPRGTYDNPKVNDGGYDVPEYVNEEGYGRGAMVTKWLPRGYYGPTIPNYLDEQFSKIVGEAPASGGGVVMKMETLGDDVAPYGSSSLGPFATYGKRVAASMMSRVAQLPGPARVPAIKAAMDAIDPTLFSRSKRYAERAQMHGLPPRAALAHGIAAAVTEGVIKELANVGSSRTAPQPRSLLGLGCYGCAAALGAMGDAAFSVSAPAGTIQSNIGSQLTTQTAEQRAATAAAQLAAGDGASLTTAKWLKVGPWELLDQEGQPTNYTVSSLTAEQSRALSQGFAKASVMAYLHAGAGGLVTIRKTSMAAMGLGSSGSIPSDVANGGYPIAKFKHPTTGASEALRFKTTGKGTFQLIWKPDPGIVQAAVDAFVAIHLVPTKALVDATKKITTGIVAEVSDLTCNLVQQPGATQAGQAAAVAGPYGMAVAAGTSIASQMCAQPAGAPLPPGIAPATDYTIPALLGAGAIALVIIAKKRKKTA